MNRATPTANNDVGDPNRIHLMRYAAGALPEQQPEPPEPPALHPTAMVKASGWIPDANGHMVHFSGARRASVAEARRMATEAEAAELARQESEHYEAVRRRRQGVFGRVLDFFRR
jgi:hypothetical protein